VLVERVEPRVRLMGRDVKRVRSSLGGSRWHVGFGLIGYQEMAFRSVLASSSLVGVIPATPMVPIQSWTGPWFRR
jgi:hypothetical protein